jgi:superfamily II RNA helicase
VSVCVRWQRYCAVPEQETKPGRRASSGGGRSKSDLHRVVDFLLSKAYDPGIIFCFSRQECEDNAALLAQKMSLINEAEANEVGRTTGPMAPVSS